MDSKFITGCWLFEDRIVAELSLYKDDQVESDSPSSVNGQIHFFLTSHADRINEAEPSGIACATTRRGRMRLLMTGWVSIVRGLSRPAGLKRHHIPCPAAGLKFAPEH